VSPGEGGVGEIILSALFRHHPRGCAVFASVLPPRYPGRPDPEFPHPVESFDGTPEHRFTRRRRKVQAPVFHLYYRTGFRRWLRHLAGEVVALGRRSRVEKVLLVANSAATIGIGARVARELGVPLVTIVWDPPEHVLSHVDRFTRRSLLGRFREAMRRSERVAVVSTAMADAYVPRGKTAVLLRYGADAAERLAAPGAPRESGVFRIGFAGSIYAHTAVAALTRALDDCGWEVAGRRVVLRMLCSQAHLASRSRAHVEYLGYRAPEEVARLLSSCDACFLPVPFEPWLRRLALYSFPTKLSDYVALGRPVLAIAPRDGAVAAFFEEQPVGACAHSLDPASVRAALEALTDERGYARYAERAAAVAAGELSGETFRARFAQLVGLASAEAATGTTR
jgi:glycosyltransferase involved in cell wall biosynthesis